MQPSECRTVLCHGVDREQSLECGDGHLTEEECLEKTEDLCGSLNR